MATATDDFFASLAARGREPLLTHRSGTLRFDLVDETDGVEHRYVRLRDGTPEVSRDDAPADAVVRVDRRTFDGMAGGTVNTIAATLRGRLAVEGDLGLLLLFQRLFPGPPAAATQPPTTPGGGAP